ncbi:MAG: pyridoxal phosphate-dependent aminotransferase [Pseudomonadales bacterium]
MTLPFSSLTGRLATPQSDVWRVHDEAVSRQARGEDVILLSVGDPDFPTPPYITDHAMARIREGRTHYSPVAGEPVLRAALAEVETRATGRRFDPAQFVVFPGATATLYAVFACLLDPRDEVVIAEPMYAAYRPLLDAIGARIRSVPLVAPDFALDPEILFAAITPKTRALLVNTPGNPCGNIIPGASLRLLADVCRARDIWLVCDEVYSLITFDAPHVSLLRSTEALDNVVVVDGLSKSHAMSGWRVGWAVAPADLAAALTRLASAAFFGCSQFVQDAAAYALMHDAPDVAAMRREYRTRRDFVIQRLDRMPELGYCRPQGGMFIMLDAHRVADDGDAFAARLLAQAGVSTLPGRAFGDSASSYVRLSLTQPLPVLARACDRIEAMLRR